MSIRFTATLGAGACGAILLLIAALAGPAGARAPAADRAVAADGVHSSLRRALGLDRAARHRRVGMRAHFRLAPETEIAPWVDILLGAGHELYVTPLPHGELLVAALAEVRAPGAPAESAFDGWCAAQPFLARCNRARNLRHAVERQALPHRHVFEYLRHAAHRA